MKAAPPGQTEVAGGLANAIASVTTLVSLAAVALVVWLCWRRRRGPADRRGGRASLGFVAFAKSFSPQYVDWLVPLVPAAGAIASGLFLVILGLTHVELQQFLHTPGGPTASTTRTSSPGGSSRATC